MIKRRDPICSLGFYLSFRTDIIAWLFGGFSDNNIYHGKRGMEMPFRENANTGPTLGFVDCNNSPIAGGIGSSGNAEPQSRREVVINGNRVKTIDVHAHCIVPEAASVIDHPLEAPGLLWLGSAEQDFPASR